MPRRLATLAAAASRLMCILALAMWVLGYWVVVAVSHEQANQVGGKEIAIASVKGSILVVSLGRDDLWPGLRGWRWSVAFADDAEYAEPGNAYLVPAREFAGFGYTHWGGGRVDRFVLLVFPYWSLVSVLLIVPAARWWWILRTRARGGRHLCPTCGYDLRATPARCPECGAVPAAAPAR